MAQINFQEDVLKRSHEVPVVVDFWAAWCGPCRVLGPVIEALADEADGAWELVKLDTETHPDVARQYGIMSIPAVKMFHNGEVIAEFVGALPRHAIQHWLDEHLPDKRKLQLDALVARFDDGADQHEQALRALAAFAGENPDLIEAQLALAWETVLNDPQQALSLVEDIREGHKHFEDAKDIRTLAELVNCEPEESASPAAIKIKAAQVALENYDREAAIQRLIDAVTIDKSYCGDMPRRAAIALFHYWGKDHPLTRKYRRLFDMALY